MSDVVDRDGVVDCDGVVLGAGLRGLGAALRWPVRPGETVRIVDRQSRAGGSVRTQRSNGFVCELGPFAFEEAAIAPLLEVLERPPAVLASGCDTGAVFDGARLNPCPVEPRPVSFAGGCEDLVQACRRELGDRMWLGREAVEIRPADSGGFAIALGGEVPATLTARQLVLALPMANAARLLAGFDRALVDVADRLEREPRAFVFLGGLTRDCRELAGYGIAPAEDVPSAAVEAIFCGNVFPGRCLPDRALVRVELAGDPAQGDDAALAERAVAELRRWTGTAAEFPFVKVHRFETIARDATRAECRARFAGIAARAPGLAMA
ncbi:MAG: FAD-dependent oxidoreductase [Planctomycetes bacterium]|nr:FAD-dependent oxidoreductase [Planctomycetota bacterium]